MFEILKIFRTKKPIDSFLTCFVCLNFALDNLDLYIILCLLKSEISQPQKPSERQLEHRTSKDHWQVARLKNSLRHFDENGSRARPEQRTPTMDPRVFLVLPEHISNAHHIWNYALFLSQVSSLNGSLGNAVVANAKSKNTSGQKQQYQRFAPPNEEHQLLEKFACDLYLNELKQDYLKLNKETILNIVKIKKRNKASLFNLILPPALSLNNVSLLAQHPNSTINQNMITTPWLPASPVFSKSNETVDNPLTEYENKQDTDSSSSSSADDQLENSTNSIYVNSSNEISQRIEVKDLAGANLPGFAFNEGCQR